LFGKTAIYSTEIFVESNRPKSHNSIDQKYLSAYRNAIVAELLYLRDTTSNSSYLCRYTANENPPKKVECCFVERQFRKL